jgi:hypothetical protein
MTPAQFDAAMRDKSYRTKPDAPKPVVKPAMGLTDDEFNLAIRNHGWRKGVSK